MKRFWRDARALEGPEGFTIALDGKPVRLPGGGALVINRAPLAQAIAAEWQAAGGGPGGEMSFADTPLTRLAGTARERIAPDPAPTIGAIAAYGATDLLCYRAERPAELVRRQHLHWQPWIAWAAATLGAELLVTEGVMPVAQRPAALAALRAAVDAASPEILAGLGIAVPALGSLVLGLALAHGALSAATAHSVAMLDEIFEVEQWGYDADIEARRAAIADDILLAGRFLCLVRP
jgi:chaperone required for assembly of F1-ATPase